MYTIHKFAKNDAKNSELNQSSKADSDGIPEQLKCPICFEVPHAEIYQCKNGHIVCCDCLANIRNCSQCRVPMKIDEEELIRVRALESLLDCMMVPCPYKSGGCREIMSRKDVKAHMVNCIHNGKCVQLCKQLGYKCDFWANGMNSGLAVDHFLINHHAEGSINLDENGSIKFNIENMKNSSEFLQADGVWTPLCINANFRRPLNTERFLILTLLNDMDRSVSWLCLKLSHADDKLGTERFEVEFDIASQEGKIPPLKWKVTPVSMLKSEEMIKFPGYRMPIELLEKHYMDKQGVLKVKVTISMIPTREPAKISNQYSRVAKQNSDIKISQITRRSETKRDEIIDNKNNSVWPKLTCREN